RVLAASSRVTALLESADIAGAEESLVRLERFAGELRQPFFSWWAHLARAMLSGMRGDADAGQKALEAFGVGMASSQPEAGAGFGAQLAGIRWAQGRSEELRDAFSASANEMPGIQAWRTALALLYCETDRPAEAREQIVVLAAGGFDVPI